MNPYNKILTKQITANLNGEAASREENDLLYPRVAAGDQQAVQQMIETNIPFVLNKVESFIKSYPGAAHLRDDLVAEGCLGLCKAVHKMAEDGPKEKANSTGYISFWIFKSLGVIVDAEAAAGPAESERHRKRKIEHGEDIAHRVEMSQASDGEFYDFIAQPLGDGTTDPMAIPDLEDLIDSCCETEVDRQIVALRKQDYTYHEVAKIIELPYATTYMLTRSIYERFLEKSGMKGEV